MITDTASDENFEGLSGKTVRDFGLKQSALHCRNKSGTDVRQSASAFAKFPRPCASDTIIDDSRDTLERPFLAATGLQ